MNRRYVAGALALCVSLTLLPRTAFAADEALPLTAPGLYSDVSSGIGPSETNMGSDRTSERAIALPDPNDLVTNDDFRRYDPRYPEHDRYESYSLQVPQLKGRLTFAQGQGEQVIGTLFAPGTSRNYPFQDATKWWTNDSNLCFAASSSNLISWYLGEYQKTNQETPSGLVTDAGAIFDCFRRGWQNEGGDQKDALAWYFTSGFAGGPAQSNQLTGDETGGYLDFIPHNISDRWTQLSHGWTPRVPFEVYGGHENKFPFIEEVGGHIGDGAFATLEGFSAHILRQLHYGACSVSFISGSTTSGSGHAITLWGADYDVETGLVSAIYITDSDDNSGSGLLKIGIEMGQGELNGNNNGIRLVGYSYPGPGTGSSFTTIRDSVVLYAPDVVVLNQQYDGPPARIDQLTPDSAGTGVEVRVTNITNRTLEYGYSYDQDANNVTNWQTDPHFPALKPDQYYFFARVKAENGFEAGGLSAPAPYRVKMPSPVSQQSVPSLFLGTAPFRPDAKAQQQYIWYGAERGLDGNGVEEPILWRVLAPSANHGGAGLFLLSERLFGSGKNGDLYFEENYPYHNQYQNSSAQQWCQRFERTHFDSLEKNGILPTTKSDASYSTGGSTFGKAEGILSGDRVFLPSAEEIMTLLDSPQSQQGWYHGGYRTYCLRSPIAQQSDRSGYVNSQGSVVSNSTFSEAAARPALNLDSSQILYAAAVGSGQFRDQLGLEKIREVPSSDFRLVLKDAGRTFQVTTHAVTGQAGGMVTLPYTGAEVSSTNHEYISVILQRTDGSPIYYGKVAPVQTASGSVQFALPHDLSDGSYTLKVFNEQYNGVRESGAASEFSQVTLTIDGQMEVTPVTKVQLTLSAPVTGQRPSAAAASGAGFTITGTVWKPAHGVFEANTHYDVSITLQANPDHTFTAATEFTVNGHPVVPTAYGQECTVTYTGFPTTQGDSSGGGTGGGGDSSGGGTGGGGDSSGGGGASGGGADSSGGGAATPTEPEISIGPDGSKIETVTGPDGTRVETITSPNGDRSVTETKKDGSVTIRTEKANGTTAQTSTDQNGRTKAEVMVSTAAERESKETGRPFELPIPSVKSGVSVEDAPVIQIGTESGEPAKVTIPVSPLTSSTVAVVVHGDGTQEIIRKSVNTKTGVTLSVKDGSVIKIVDNAKDFSDVHGHWAHNSIAFVTSHELYAGTSATIFSPDASMSRGMLAVVLHNLEHNPDVTAESVFQDVEDGTWYNRAICWAAEKEIIQGYGNGQFGPNDRITREQLAVILYRYAGAPAHSGKVLDFQDAHQISGYDLEAMQWAVESGIIRGTGNGTLNPQGVATRAQTATMLMHLLETIETM